MSFVEANQIDLGGVPDGLGAGRIVERRERPTTLWQRKSLQELLHTFTTYKKHNSTVIDCMIL